MEFRFDLSDLFRHPIVKINNSMLPSGFVGDRRTALEATAKIAEVVNDIGETSAKSQGLSVPVTSGEKLRRSDHVIYLLNEKNDKKGLVTGFLKIGKKSLYLFNEQGKTVYVSAICLLDFWIHESRQRQGWGGKLFQYMLEQENLLPQEVAYDRPSPKLLNFLNKYYGLYTKIQQLNNFVIFDGFFDNKGDLENVDRRMRITASPNCNLFGPQFVKEDEDLTHHHATNQRRSNSQTRGAVSNPLSPSMVQQQPLGRYAAPKPMSSMSQIIHNAPTTVTSESPNSTNEHYYQEYNSLHSPSSQAPVNHEAADEDDDDEQPEGDYQKSVEDLVDGVAEIDFAEQQRQASRQSSRPPSVPQSPMRSHAVPESPRSTTNGHHTPTKTDGTNGYHQQSPRNPKMPVSKMHTGQKNISSNVFAAVSPGQKMEFDQEKNEGFGSVKINRPIRNPNERHETDSVMSHDSRMTEQGHFDLKYYHNRLW
ncbi:alpha-tubulin N-acetyltransferase isoform X2 [Culicoides brevitarsis]|uniref:alpha-tubulin N-acetyltransferase isoform X2 n=1 Tax=Culicoides brevitarsis TaxID=469753 RepID=UPI00307C5198